MKATMHFDGACRGNPGGRSAGAAVISNIHGGDHRLDSFAYAMGKTRPVVVHGVVFHGTNNEAEYHGLLAGLHEALKLGISDLTIYGDSKLVVEQVAGRWRCHKAHLKPLLGEAWALLENIHRWRISWIPREHNTEADRASNEALDMIRSPAV